MNEQAFHIRKHIVYTLLSLIGAFLISILPSSAQNPIEQKLLRKLDSLKNTELIPHLKYELYPNNAIQGIMVPSGWGSFGTWVFGAIGGAYPQVYSNEADLSSTGGVAFGDPVKSVSVAVSLNVYDISALDNISANLTLSRSLSKGSSITVGALGLFTSEEKSDAPEATYFLAFSHAVQSMPSKTTPYGSKLSYTIGVGNARFLLKSESDIKAGKGKYGTGVFGSVSYELLKNVNFNAEWTGLNLGFSLGAAPFKMPLSLGVGIINLTGYSADKPNIVFSAGYSLSLRKIKI